MGDCGQWLDTFKSVEDISIQVFVDGCRSPIVLNHPLSAKCLNHLCVCVCVCSEQRKEDKEGEIISVTKCG